MTNTMTNSQRAAANRDAPGFVDGIGTYLRPPMELRKQKALRSTSLQKSARGQHCTLQIVRCCTDDTDTSVLAHLPDESSGRGRKSDDIAAVIACDACHAVIDGRAKWPPGEEEYREMYMRRGLVRTYRHWWHTGDITIRNLKEK